jgi:hypothetical protein
MAQDSSLGSLPRTNFETALSLQQTITLVTLYIPIVKAETSRVWKTKLSAWHLLTLLVEMFTSNVFNIILDSCNV